MESTKEPEKKGSVAGTHCVCSGWQGPAEAGAGAREECERMNEIGGDGPGLTNEVRDATTSHFSWVLGVDRIILGTGCKLI